VETDVSVANSTDILPPTPPASDELARRAMKGNRRSDTAPEIALRRLLHARGLRFRKDHAIVADGIRARADLVFTRRRVAVFVDGCFWHGCARHCRMPARNSAYWRAKIGRNRARDERVTAELTAHGWKVVRIWEHEPLDAAAQRVVAALSER
jgi:DNA mismatch endonuclease (patch repair protein)